MPCADIVNRTMRVAPGVGFGLGDFVVMCLALLLVPPPPRRKAAPLGGHPAPGTLVDPEWRPGQEDRDVGPEWLRQSLERSPMTRHQPPVPRVPTDPAVTSRSRKGWRQLLGDAPARDGGPEDHLLKVGLLLAVGFNLGLLLIRVFGAPRDDARPEEAPGRPDGTSGSSRWGSPSQTGPSAV